MNPRISNESPREGEILDAIYAAGPSSVADVRARLADPPSYSAVRTLLTRLVAKGHLRFRRDGLRYVYSPTTERDVVSRQALRQVLNKYFGGSLAQAVTAMLDDRSEAISEEEAQEIRRRLAAAKKEGR